VCWSVRNGVCVMEYVVVDVDIGCPMLCKSSGSYGNCFYGAAW
jgi:hypothetical protein